MIKMINVNMDVSFDAEDLKISCAEAGQFCTTDLPCKDCPFCTGPVSLDYLINEYTILLAKEVAKHD